MEYVTLSNGLKMPKAGYGVYQISKEECSRCVFDAIKVGYRLIDTAQSYFNEKEVGDGIKKAIDEGIAKREELFITTKVWIDKYGYENCKKSIEDSMKKLKVNYIDLVLLHQPFGDYYGAYHALEDLYEKGKVKAIGVSNFYPDRLSDICAFNRIKPHVNQVETNIFNQQIEAQKNMIKNEVQMEAWAPFGEGRNNMFSNPILKEIGKKYNKSIAQVILRWLTERNIVVLSKSTLIERIKENYEIFDFHLSEEDMKEIAKLDTKTSLFFNHQTPEAVDMFVKFVEERRNRE